MKTITKLMMIALVVGLLGVPNVLAQRNYDPKTVETIEGKVLSIEKTTLCEKTRLWRSSHPADGEGNDRGAFGTGLVYRQANAKYRSQRHNHRNRVSRNDRRKTSHHRRTG